MAAVGGQLPSLLPLLRLHTGLCLVSSSLRPESHFSLENKHFPRISHCMCHLHFILIALSARQLKPDTFHPASSVYFQEEFPVSGLKDRTRAEGPRAGWNHVLPFHSVPMTMALLVGTGLPPSRQFVYVVFACFLSLRFLKLLTDVGPFYPRPHLASPYLLVLLSL